MNIAFFGTPLFAAAQLKHLIDSGYRISVVITAPDKPAGRGRTLSSSAVKNLAQEYDLTVWQPTDLKNPEFVQAYKALKIDIAVVVAFRMLPKAIWSSARIGTFNLHASLLPQYRGAAPIQWALINGEEVTGLTTFLIDEQIDTGSILLSKSYTIGKNETGGSLHDSLLELGKALIMETITGLENTSLTPSPQTDDHTNLKSAPKLTKENTRLSPSLSVSQAKRLVTALNPFPAAHGELVHPSGKRIKVKMWSVELSNFDQLAPEGTLVIEDKTILIRFKNGWIKVQEWQLEGKKRVSIADFLNGNSNLSGYKWA